MRKYVIKSNERNRYFIAVHSFTPFFGSIEKARKFLSDTEAKDYALNELFTHESAFQVIPYTE